jgi:hypothetical protein
VVKIRILSVLLAVALSASTGGAATLLHLCGMDGELSLQCYCPHAEDPNPCGTIEKACCELKSSPGVPGSAQATSDRTTPTSSPLALRAAHLEPISAVGSTGSRLASEWGAPARAGPPIFLAICSYLI